MARPSEYDRCACGARKHKSSARCRSCHRRRLKVAREARKWARAVTLGEPLIMVLRGEKPARDPLSAERNTL